MFSRLGDKLYQYAEQQPLWTNVYGLARTLLASSLALLLLFNPTKTFFRPGAGLPEFPLCDRNLSVFCMVPNDFFYFELIRWIFIILLLGIASGWRPRITGILHFYITYSFYSTALTLDGGEQVNVTLTLLLIPLTLTDPRKWHWQRSKKPDISSHRYMFAFITGLCAYIAIRFQVAIIYLNAAYAKVPGEFWKDGTAVYYFFQDTLLGISDTMGKILMPLLETPLVVIPTWGTVILEFLLFAALFTPAKYWKWFFIPGLIFHFMISAVVGLHNFVIVMFAALILFLRPLQQEFSIQAVLNFLMLPPRIYHRLRKNTWKGGELEKRSG
ncbi:sporulation-delaying protein SdpB family protein [Paraliobacillus sp. JSM ZJ581]|uniref:sporulation-delaying protein SdpB family protein n=1 Tax=Paraliobacillus sp. JSM ZJ581 TaxID=3342118 RepID=UPI0035A96134